MTSTRAPVTSPAKLPAWSRANAETALELRRLRYFIAVAEELSFTRAAVRVHIAQPPLSQQIRSLEEGLGMKLFLRSGRRVQLTPAGSAMLLHARRLVNAAGQALDEMQAMREGRRGDLSIGAIYSSIYTLVPPLLRAFAAEMPDVRVRVQEMTVLQQVEALRHGVVDLGIIRGSVTDPAIVTETLYEEPLVVALPSDHPLAARQVISPYELSGEPFIGYGERFSRNHRDLVAALFAGRRRRPPVVQEVNDMHTLVGLVGAGVGVSLVAASLQRIQTPHVAYRPLTGTAPRIALALAWTEDNASPLRRRFVEMARVMAHTTAAG